MGLTAKQFAERCGRRSTGAVRRWFEAGYLPGATRDEKTGIYDIPEDTPIPYTPNKKTKRNTALWFALLDAADMNRMVAASMFPLIVEKDFEAILQEMIDDELLELVKLSDGRSYLRIRHSGQNFLNRYADRAYRKGFVEKVERMLTDSASVLTIAQCLAQLGTMLMK